MNPIMNQIENKYEKSQLLIFILKLKKDNIIAPRVIKNTIKSRADNWFKIVPANLWKVKIISEIIDNKTKSLIKKPISNEKPISKNKIYKKTWITGIKKAFSLHIKK